MTTEIDDRLQIKVLALHVRKLQEIINVQNKKISELQEDSQRHVDYLNREIKAQREIANILRRQVDDARYTFKVFGVAIAAWNQPKIEQHDLN